MTYSLSQRSISNLRGVHPDLVAVVHRAIEITTQDFIVIEGVRTQERQDELWAQGRTKPGPIVTWTKDASSHGIGKDGYGHAVDICPFPVDWNDLKKFDAIAKAMLTQPLKWAFACVGGRIGTWMASLVKGARATRRTLSLFRLP